MNDTYKLLKVFCFNISYITLNFDQNLHGKLIICNEHFIVRFIILCYANIFF